MKPADIKNVEIRDEFWSRKQALVRKEVIPYQWEILNDRIPEAEASYCSTISKLRESLMKR